MITHSKEELEKLVEKETATIAELEANPVPLDTTIHYHDRKNLPYHIYLTEIKDAYWRRRNWQDMLKGLDISPHNPG